MLKLKLIIGLGNPNPEYQNTYHNVGHLMVGFAVNLKFKISNLKLLKTDVFMNKSGLFVKEEIKKEKVKPEELLIVHDDSDIEFGKFKLSFARNSAGHKGVQNIINQLKTKNFWRLRIGIRPSSAKASEGRVKADELVLKKITPARMKILEKVFKDAIMSLRA